MIESIKQELRRLSLPDGGDLVSRDMVRALRFENGKASFVIEAPSAGVASQMEPLRLAATQLIGALDGVQDVSIVVTSPTTAPNASKPLKFGGHATPQTAPLKPASIKTVIGIASGKGGVGKSTVSSNLAVALSKAGKKVGLLDADIYGPSQPRMMGVSGPLSKGQGDEIIPLQAHGVTLMSVGFMIDPDKAVVWRGPMLMGAMQQMMTQVAWGELDVLLIDLPPGTGDVQLTLCQKGGLDAAIIVSTPQDVALIDAKRAIDMFYTLKTPVLGLIENMSLFTCPDCGYEAHVFGHGGVADTAKDLGLPLLAALPIDLETRLAGDQGTPVAAGDGAMAQTYARLAKGLIDSGLF